MTDEPCPHCQEPGCDSECLLIGTGAPGRFRALWLREQARIGAQIKTPTPEPM